MLSAEGYETRKVFNFEKKYGLFIYKNMHYIANSLCKIKLKTHTTYYY